MQEFRRPRSCAAAGAGLALAIGACDKAESAGKPGGSGGGGGGPPAMPVEVAVARTDTVVDAILATGQIEAMQSIELRPDVEGRIARILVREGAFVDARARRSSRWTTPSSRPRWRGRRPTAISPASR